MSIKSFIVNNLPEAPAFGEAITSTIRHAVFPLWLQVREQVTDSKVGDQKTLLIERVSKLEAHQGISSRFYVSGRTGECAVARKGQYVYGWLDDEQGSGELIVSDDFIA